MSKNLIRQIVPLKGLWPCTDPFLFCAYHLDDYPKANTHMGPAESLKGRNIGQDFAGVGGWNMYHADKIPGFPQHPHRGFETVTIVRKGIVDHADSLGAAARFGHGDTQWITSGKGISHSEMFPLLSETEKNPLDLFQIWLNLPKKNKLVDPYFSIFWNEKTPRVNQEGCELTLIAGGFGGQRALAPPPNSWASQPESDLAIWILKMKPGAHFTIPKTLVTTKRTVYFFRGSSLEVSGTQIDKLNAIFLNADSEALLINGDSDAEILMLQGKPLNEPVAQYGPFVMNTESEIKEAFSEYQRTRFGGWPWKDDAPVHPKKESRFARYPDGLIEKP